MVHEHNQSLEEKLQHQLRAVLNNRLGNVETEIQRLQSSFNEACQSVLLRTAAKELTTEETDQLRQLLRTGSELQSQLSAAETEITSLRSQLAASQAAVAAGAGVAAPASVNFGAIHLAVADLDAQRSQADALSCLVKHAANFAPRVVFYVIKGSNAIGWKASGFTNGLNDETVRALNIPVSTAALLYNAIEHQRSVNISDSEIAANPVLGSFGGPQPQSAIAVPLTVRGKVAAILYADSGTQNSGAIQSDALEALLRVTSLIVELLPVRRTSDVPPRPAETQAAAPAPAPAPEVRATAAPATSAPPVATPVFYGGMGDEAPAIPTTASAPATVEAAAPAEAAVAFAPTPAMQPEVQEMPAPVVPAPVVEESQPVAQSPVVAPTPAPARPAGTSSQRGPTLPADASDAEVRAHNDAKRFARLLVSEIKLYNEAKVNEGRRSGDLYERLKEDIDRSRQMYEKRVQPSVAAKYDYFYDELLHTLGEGDPDKLGGGCPGPTVPLN